MSALRTNNRRFSLCLIPILLTLSIVTGCSAPEPNIEAIVEATVVIAVQQTVEAIPTQTPLPTYTPYPTLVPTPTTDPVPDAFRNRLDDFLKAGNNVVGSTSQGVTIAELSRLVNETRGAYEYLYVVWPDTVSSESRLDFENAFVGWELALYLWQNKLQEYDEPVEPNINRYLDFVAYSDLLYLDTHPEDFIVEEYRGKKFVVFENIEILMAVAGNHFRSGQEKVLPLVR